MLGNRSIRRSAVLGALVLGLTMALVTSASAARRDAPIAMVVRPAVTALHEPVTVYVTTVGAGWLALEPVTVQFKECGLTPTRFRDAVEVPSTAPLGGAAVGNWVAVIAPLASGTVRATIDPNVKSDEVKVQTRPHVRLASTKRDTYRVAVEARLSFRGKHIEIQRYDRGRSRWLPLRTVALNRTDPVKLDGIRYVWSRSSEFVLKLPAGTKLRAVFPLSQAKPCYAAGYSMLVRT
jgi:hypothetical protein